MTEESIYMRAYKLEKMKEPSVFRGLTFLESNRTVVHPYIPLLNSAVQNLADGALIDEQIEVLLED